MENLTLAHPVEASAVAGLASGPRGSSVSGSSSVMAPNQLARPRTRRQHQSTLLGSEKRDVPPSGSEVSYESPPPRKLQETGELRPLKRPNIPVYYQRGSRELADADARAKQHYLDSADMLENADEELCDTEEDKVAFRAFKAKFASFYRELASRTGTEPVVSYVARPRDTPEEHLTAEEMERKADSSGWLLCPQARHFARLALEHYNSSKKAHKFELGRVLLSKCFSEADATTFAHVNFTAIPEDSPMTKRLLFAELMLIPDLQAYEGAEPMRVVHVCTIDDDSCFGGCHEMEREIKKPVRKNLDYDRCHACSDRIKHPRGDQFNGGHDRTRMPYFSANAWTWK